MQTITPELEALLKSKFQAAASGFRARLEIDTFIPGSTEVGATVDVNLAYGTMTAGGGRPPASPTNGNDGNGSTYTTVSATIVGSGTYLSEWITDLGAAFAVSQMVITHTGPYTYPNLDPSDTGAGTWSDWRGRIAWSDDGSTWTDFTPDVTETYDGMNTHTYDFAELTHRYWKLSAKRQFSGLNFTGYLQFDTWAIQGASTDVIPPSYSTASYQCKTVSLNKSLRMTADQAEVELANEGLPLGWGPTNAIKTNQRARIYHWFGDEANAIRTFTGVVDRVTDHRDVLATLLTFFDMMQPILIDQTFSATAPQGADEDGAVRTEDNGVYLNREVSYIVADLVTRAGWPSADVAITDTSYVLDEFIVADGASYAETIIGDEQLTGLVGYSAWADELGVFHFAPTSISQNLTAPVDPAYTFRSGEDIVSLDDETSQDALRTRVKVRGPLTTQTLQDTWRELWRTSKITQPVGIWYDPSDSANIRVISRSTKRLYKLRQSDRVVLSSVNLGAVISHPLGLSGDPADATVYWVLDAPWIYTGSTSGNSVKKVRKSDNHVLATYGIPNGRWSALKVSSSSLWLTNLDTDRFYQRSKADGTAIDDFRHTYSSTLQSNPSGVMVDGTTLYLFWSNGGTTARFLKCDESDPGTVTGVVKTAGTSLHGGEMDTTTHTECYGDSDSLNLVAKFTLLEAVDQTDEVFAEVVDVDLEDELGGYAQLEPRVHDAHPGDDPHAFEMRRLTLDLKVITSLAQATETAQRQLDLASVRSRVLDAGIIGNPALQKTDPVAVVDPVTGISDTFVIDTYRSTMSADGTYLGTLALLPVASLDDDPTDDGDAS